MVRSAVVTDDTGAVDAKHHVQFLQRHIVNDVIVGTLHERGVDIAIGQHTCFGETGTKRDGMTFGDTDVEYAIG